MIFRSHIISLPFAIIFFCRCTSLVPSSSSYCSSSSFCSRRALQEIFNIINFLLLFIIEWKLMIKWNKFFLIFFLFFGGLCVDVCATACRLIIISFTFSHSHWLDSLAHHRRAISWRDKTRFIMLYYFFPFFLYRQHHPNGVRSEISEKCINLLELRVVNLNYFNSKNDL